MLGVTTSTSEAETAAQGEMVFKEGMVAEKRSMVSTLVSELAEKLSKKEHELKLLACCSSQLGGWGITASVRSVLTSPSWNPRAWIPQEELGGRKKE